MKNISCKSYNDSQKNLVISPNSFRELTANNLTNKKAHHRIGFSSFVFEKSVAINSYTFSLTKKVLINQNHKNPLPISSGSKTICFISQIRLPLFRQLRRNQPNDAFFCSLISSFYMNLIVCHRGLLGQLV